MVKHTQTIRRLLPMFQMMCESLLQIFYQEVC